MAQYSGVGCTSGVCNVCGKVLKSSAPEAMVRFRAFAAVLACLRFACAQINALLLSQVAHQRESSTCVAKPSRNAPPGVRKAEAEVMEAIEEGRRLQANGTFEEIEQNACRRKEAEAALKQARGAIKREKQAIKDLAAASMSAANWTGSLASALTSGDADATRFDKGDDTVDERLAAATVGLVSAEEFREKRESLEAAAARERAAVDQARRDAEANRARKKLEKKRKREQEQKRGLSFEDGDEAE